MSEPAYTSFTAHELDDGVVELTVERILVRGVGVACALVLAIILVGLPQLSLTVRNETGDLCYQKLFKPGDKFTVRFTHSVTKGPVDETFTITADGEIMLIETTYDSFGAGLPFEPYKEQCFLPAQGKFKMVGYDYAIPVLTVRVGRFADHRLIINEEDTALATWTDLGCPIDFTVERVRLYQYVYREVGVWCQKSHNNTKKQ